MTKKLSILLTLILIINIQVSYNKDLKVVYAEESNANTTTKINTENTSKQQDTENRPAVNPERKADIVQQLGKNFESNIDVYKTTKPKKVYTEEELATIEKYKNQVIPVYYYINDDSFEEEYNKYHPIYLVIALLEKQSGLNLELVPVRTNSAIPIEEQLKTRKSEELSIDVVKSNNLALFDERYKEVSVSKPIFNDALYVVNDGGSLGFIIEEGETIGYDTSTYSLQTDTINRDIKLRSMSPKEANQGLKNNVADYYFATNTLNLPTIMDKSDYMYSANKPQPVLKNVISSLNGLVVNDKNADLMAVLDSTLTVQLTTAVKNYNESYTTVVKEVTFYKSLTDKEVEFIKSADDINVVYNDSKNILHLEDDKYVGLIPDIMEQVNALTGIETVYTQPNTLSYALGDETLKAKDVNVIALYTDHVAKRLIDGFNASESGTTYSALLNSFSHQMEIMKYYETPDITSLTQLKFSDLGTTTSFLENTTAFLETNNVATDNLTVFDTKEELIEAIQNGDVDYGFVTPGTMSYYASYIDYGISTAHIKQNVINTPSEDWTILIHSNQDVESLNAIISKSVSTMDTAELFRRWFETKPEYDVFNKLNQTNEFLLYFSTILIVFALTILTHFNNNRQRNFNKVNRAVNYDSLTKLKNNNAFRDEKANIVEGIFIVGEFTRYKYATQLYGTKKASQIIKKQAEIMKDLCGEENIYRINTEKFFIVLEDADEGQINNITKNIFNEMSKGVNIDGYAYQLGWVMASSPISLFNNKINEVISVTNMSCENCEFNGKFKYIIVDEKEYLTITENKKIKNSLKIINQNNVYPFYQPFLDAESLKVKGCEVLARLIINGEIIPAYKFINEAEKLGTLGDIDEMLLEKTIALRSDLLVKGVIDSSFYFSVNLSAQYLKKMTSDDLYNLARRFNLKSFDFLQIEILEEELSKDEIVKIKRIIREFNLRTAIDDFSTGHSTIGRLNNFNFDVVKMDRSLLPINFTDLDKQIYLSLISMVSGFSSEIVVEGVETEEHVEFLQKTSVSTLQGFYFAKPMASNDFIDYILTTNEI